MSLRFQICVAAAVLISSTLAEGAYALDVDKLAIALSELRGEIEDLSSSIEDEKNRGRTTVQSLELRKAELEATSRRLQARVDKLTAKKAALEKQQSLNSDKRTALHDATQKALELVRGYVSQGLPFRLAERLAELDQLEVQLRDKKIAPIRALGMLWERIEDELRLTRESGLDRQVIEVDGQEFLTPVIRVGMLMLFYLSDDGVAGRAIRENGAWTWAPYEVEEQTQQVVSLFDSFKKRIRVGLFNIPNAVTDGGAK